MLSPWSIEYKVQGSKSPNARSSVTTSVMKGRELFLDDRLTYTFQQPSILLAQDSWIWGFSCCDFYKLGDRCQAFTSVPDPVSVAAFESECQEIRLKESWGRAGNNTFTHSRRKAKGNKERGSSLDWKTGAEIYLPPNLRTESLDRERVQMWIQLSCSLRDLL